ncbi:hypothetical protein GCM10011531_07150 [Aquaticitalea lipolytica]|uniref:KAP NTPase domain-containing protein n=1 Tax=Aquaticitalea lipolytica TaxID=1247562 RepID=A0A8J2TMV6_9FLAO|nr:P-loop NTPase fold protein [Aquaticitalea lipolytica]GFZ79791.1 hypothetical protein GCM10011531_07150 [Aquaticitalea lipolytica]
MWNDNETNSDFIDFQHLVGAVTSIIDNEALLPCSIGIYGDWGSGKSSLMKMIGDKYNDDDDILTISFNGWLFEGYEDTKTVLMSRIVDEIIKKRTLGEKGLKLAAKLLRKIDLIKLGRSAVKHGLGYLTMGPAGVALTTSSDIIKKLSTTNYEDYIKTQTEQDPDEALRTNIQEFHLNFEELINETKIKKIIVFIDDLDRCSHDTVIATLEAIKLFLFAKNTAFVIGADERLIRYAVRRRFPDIPGDNTEIGRDYLEKLIQYPIRIPPLNGQELAVYVNLLFTSLYTDIGEFEFVRESVLKKKNEDQFGFNFALENVEDFVKSASEDLKETLSLSAQLIPVLTVGLNGNPRQTKRFLNTLLLRQEMAKSKGETLNKRILSKLMLLEYFKPETFKSFYEEQANNDGIVPEIGLLEKYANGTNSKDDKELTIEQDANLQDSWLKNWYTQAPLLADENLQSYFYYSRDKLSVSGVNLQRMSSQAQEVFRKLMSDSETIRNSALKLASSISIGDASGIYQSLAEKMTQEGKQKGDTSTLKRLIDFCTVRRELISQLLSLINSMPHQALPLSVATWVEDIVKDSDYEPMGSKLLQVWSTSTSNKGLSRIAKQKIK